VAAELHLVDSPFSRFEALVDDHGGASFIFHILVLAFTIFMTFDNTQCGFTF